MFFSQYKCIAICMQHFLMLDQGNKLGDHRASVFIMGLPVIDPGVTFKVRRQTDLEADVLSKFIQRQSDIMST